MAGDIDLKLLWKQVTGVEMGDGINSPWNACTFREGCRSLAEKCERLNAEIQRAVAAERERCASYCDGEGLYQTARAIRAGEHARPNDGIQAGPAA